MLNVYDVIIVGGGTSGLFCAYEASKKGLRVALLEQKEHLAEKLRLAGGGMGNMTNRSLNFYDMDYTPKNNKQISLPHSLHVNNTAHAHYVSHHMKEAEFLLRSLFHDFSCDDGIKLLEEFNIPYEEREYGQIFCLKPVKTFVELLTKACCNVDFYTNTLVKNIHYTKEEEEICYCVRLEEAKTQEKIRIEKQVNKDVCNTDFKELFTKKLVIATGSSAYPQIGASDFGLRLAKKWGHRVHTFYPALVPLTLKGFASADGEVKGIDLSGLEGISLSVRMTVSYGKKIFQDPCDVRPLLFTHKGVSGPACLVNSCFVASCEAESDKQDLTSTISQKNNKPIVSIDFLPQFDLLQIMHASENGKKILKNILLPLLPDRLAYRLMPANVQNKKVAELSKKQRQSIVNAVHKAQFYVTGNEGFKKAEVASGGVCLKDINNQMESRLYKGLYFCGEIVDITGLLGGYNIHFAFASAKRVTKAW